MALAHVLAGPEDAYRVAQESLLLAWRRWRSVSELARPDVWVRDACARIATSRRGVLSGARRVDGPVLTLPERAERQFAEVRALPSREARERALAMLSDDLDHAGSRSAVGSLRDEARYVDPQRGLADLAVARRRHRVRTAVVVVTVLAVVTAVFWFVGGPSPDEDVAPGPEDPPGSGAVVSTLRADGTTGEVLVEGGSSKVLVSELHDGTPLVSPVDLEVSPEGDKLAVVGEDTLQVVGLGDNRTSTTVPCLRCRFVDWMGFKVGILLVTSFGAQGPSTQVYGDDGVARGALKLPEGIVASGYSPDRLSMVGVSELGRGDARRSRLFVLDDGTGVRTPLPDTESAPGRFIYDVTWSPDGVQVGYIEAGEYNGSGIAAQDYRLMVASRDGTEVHEVADLGRCVCVQTADPRFAWSPDGSSLVAVTVATQDSADTSEVRVFSLDGEVGSVLQGGAPVDWGPKAP